MKNASLLLNAILILAVGFLYYKVFNDKKTTPAPAHAAKNIPASENTDRPPIAYVELDSLNENITYIKNKRKELEAEQKAIENEWENGYRGLEAKKNNFIKAKGNNITQEEAEKFQNELLQQQQQIDMKKQNATQRLSQKSLSFMEDIQKHLKDYLDDYNKDKNYMYILTTGTGLDYMVYKDSTLNITKEVVDGMNEKLKNAKGQ